MRENILDALTKEIGAADHAIILTHDIDFVLVQSVVLPKLRAIGGPRLTIFADAGCAQESFGRQHRLLSGLGSTYRVVPVDLGPYRRFHPKAWLLANRDRAVAAVGSGNLTFGGLSANREVWARGASDGEGANLIAALRAYLPQILANVPLSAVVADGVAAAFNPEFAWVGGLGEPAGVAMAPAARPLLDQIGDYVTGDVERVSVVTPFFDKEAAALAEIARRFQVPVTAYVQPSRAGLSKGAADRLPELVSIGTANCNAGEGDRAIHAKIFAFHRKDDVILAVGSANCSQAALTLGPEACNAEMVVIQTASLKDAAEFLAGVALDEVPPTTTSKASAALSASWRRARRATSSMSPFTLAPRWPTSRSNRRTAGGRRCTSIGRPKRRDSVQSHACARQSCSASPTKASRCGVTRAGSTTRQA
jgi:HKD family nuclease